jgi:CRP-like cAMP-binding protein
MRRKTITLDNQAILWEAGDVARDIALVESGKLGVRTAAGVVGLVLPGMALGETALFALDGQPLHRTATIYALESETRVVSTPAEDWRACFEGGDTDVVLPLVRTLVGQICRNLLMVVSARRGDPFVDQPLGALLRGVADDASRPLSARTWTAFMVTFSFLSDLRDLSDRILSRLGPEPAERLDLIEAASQALAVLGGDTQPMIEAFLEAERQRTEWWARGGQA